MSTARCNYETRDIIRKKIAIHDDRVKPITVKDLNRRQPLTVLKDRITAWPTHDLRADSYVQNREPDLRRFKATDEDLITDITEGIELKVVKKDLINNILEIAAEFQTNIDEFERYNLAVENHNQEWRRQGSKKKVFNPITGEMVPIPDSYVDPAHITSTNYPMPASADEGVSYGPLAKARPQITRKPVILAKYHLKVNADDFTLSYVVYDKDKLVIYYNEVTHKDLSALVRRSVQEIWGNPFIYGNSGPVLEGISALIQGRKIPLCKELNTLPVIIGTDVIKNNSTKLLMKEAEQKTAEIFEGVFRIWVPTITGIAFIVHSLICFMNSFGEGSKPGQSESFLLGLVVSAVVISVSFVLSYYLDRSISKIEAEKKFI